jgi:hypothetical protein
MSEARRRLRRERTVRRKQAARPTACQLSFIRGSDLLDLLSGPSSFETSDAVAAIAASESRICRLEGPVCECLPSAN